MQTMKKPMKPSPTSPRTRRFFASAHAKERFVERFNPGAGLSKAGEVLERRARRARPLPSLACSYSAGERVLMLRDGSLVLVVDLDSRIILTCYPYEKATPAGLPLRRSARRRQVPSCVPASTRHGGAR